jgi:glucose/mannose-6-phosphate isomerase
MEKLVAQFPRNILDALEIARNTDFDALGEYSFSNVVICGMGGSGIGGRLVAQWTSSVAKIPIIVHQDYEVPAYVNGKTLFIASSYSGNTEETITAMKKAASLGARVVGICSGGELFRFCMERAFPVIKVPGGNPPRSALAFSVAQLLHVLQSAKIISGDFLKWFEGSKAHLSHNLETIKQEAKRLAAVAHKRNLILYSSSNFEAVTIRARQQFNENSKQLCWHHTIPEMNHNELVGWYGGNSTHAVVFFKPNNLSPANDLRFRISEGVVSEKTPHFIVIEGKGSNIVEESFYFIHIVDWASLFLADLNQKDPIDIRVIDYLKGELNKL